VQKKYYVLDASAFIGGYRPSNPFNYTIPEVTHEVKDINSKTILETAIKDGYLQIIEPDLKSMERVQETIKSSGDVLRLSHVDQKLIALALHLKNQQENVIVITDDYTIQNALKILKIPFKSVLTSGIKQIYGWKLICKGCKKEYSDDYPFDDCEICGSSIYKKRIKNKNK